MPFEIGDFHKTLKVLHVGVESPRAYFIPFRESGDAREGKRNYSPYFKSLIGAWDFKFYPSVLEAEDPRGSVDFLEKIDVPSNWQHAQGRAYDKIQYTNVEYPFPFNPPHVPEENPAAIYKRSFTLTAQEIKD